jgi:hypothetical protein
MTAVAKKFNIHTNLVTRQNKSNNKNRLLFD